MTEWKGKYEDWRIDWVTYGGPYIRYPAWPHPENNLDIARLSFADPTPFEAKRQRAALIAAAPDMFEALNAVLVTRGKPMPEEYVDADASYRLALSAWEEATAALAKARGR
jgi:hypothetical protein